MWTLLTESLIIGFVSFIIGIICFNLTINETNKTNKNDKDKKNLHKIGFIFFITGIILHIFLEFVGFNKWYCDKKTTFQCHNLTKI